MPPPGWRARLSRAGRSHLRRSGTVGRTPRSRGLGALVAAAQNEQFDVVLVDDLSHLARDNYLMLSVMAELHFEGVRVISVADGLDSDDEATLSASRSVGSSTSFWLRDLKKRTLRGRRSQRNAASRSASAPSDSSPSRSARSDGQEGPPAT
ncbi:MAG: recombinase family protein [Myxococcota bacterium]